MLACNVEKKKKKKWGINIIIKQIKFPLLGVVKKKVSQGILPYNNLVCYNVLLVEHDARYHHMVLHVNDNRCGKSTTVTNCKIHMQIVGVLLL